MPTQHCTVASSMPCSSSGVYFAPSQFEAGFVSTAHGAEEIAATHAAMRTVLGEFALRRSGRVPRARHVPESSGRQCRCSRLVSYDKIQVKHRELPVAIVGGGIAGLSTAYYLQKAGVPYVLLEQGDRWGGKIYSEHVTVADGSTFRRRGWAGLVYHAEAVGRGAGARTGAGRAHAGDQRAAAPDLRAAQGQAQGAARRRADDRAHQVQALCLLDPDLAVGQAAHGDGPLYPAAPRSAATRRWPSLCGGGWAANAWTRSPSR